MGHDYFCKVQSFINNLTTEEIQTRCAKFVQSLTSYTSIYCISQHKGKVTSSSHLLQSVKFMC